MRIKTKILILISICCPNLSAQIKCSDNYFQKNGLIYLGKDTFPFHGVYKDYYPGQIKTEAHYRNGLLNGEYISYSQFGKIEYCENYLNGIKQGVAIKYFNRACSRWVISREYFNKGSLDSGFYWTDAGIIKKIEINSSQRKVLSFPIDSDIFSITPWMALAKSEYVVESGCFQYKISKKDFYNKDSVKVNIAKITCKDCYTEMPTYLDTTLLDNYKIKSFYFVPLFRGMEVDYLSKNGYIPKTMLDSCKKANLDRFYLSDIIIIDPQGIEYVLSEFTYVLTD